MAEDHGLAYDSEISKDVHNVSRFNAPNEVSMHHIKDIHFSNQSLLMEIDKELAYLQRKRAEINSLIEPQ